MRIREKIFHLVDEDYKATPFALLFDILIISLIIINVIAIILESFEELYLKYYSGFRLLELITIIIFTLEYLMRFLTADFLYPNLSKLRAVIKFIFSPYGLIDLLAILPFYLPFLIPLDLRFIRILRLLRVARILKMGRYSKSLRLIEDVLIEKRRELGITLFIAFVLIVVASTLMYYIEGKVQPEAFPNVIAAFWWAVATLTTVGYGDVYPVTTLGKILSACVAIIGIGLVALPTGILSAALIERLRGRKKMDCPHCGKEIEL
ncbi:MAG: ion transporter [Ignavibacteria bacterium]|nr:ion transporter [Ignavibacteria bacterium]